MPGIADKAKVVRVREGGQVTIPASYRKKLGIEENSVLTALEVEGTIFLVPQQLLGPKVASAFRRAIRQKGVSKEQLMDGLKQQRQRYNKERYVIR